MTLAGFGEELALYAGNDSQIYPTLSLGGQGVISVASNLFPREISKLCSDFFGGRKKEALEEQLHLLPLVRALFLETNPSPVKYAMSLSGLCSAELRLPLGEPRESTKESIKEALERFMK